MMASGLICYRVTTYDVIFTMVPVIVCCAGFVPVFYIQAALMFKSVVLIQLNEISFD